jgi:hypothetical protein
LGAFPSTFNAAPVKLTAASGRNPSHPSLRFKRVHTIRPIYSARIGLDYRALAVVDGDAVIWFWIGSHAECDQLLRTL